MRLIPIVAVAAAFALAALLLFGGGQDAGAQTDAPTLSVTDSGLATWSYTLPDGASFTYSEVRWKLYDPSEDINDWSGRSSQVFYSANASEYQIPSLSANTQYKAKVFVSVQQNGGAVYLKSNVVVFPQPEPTATPTATSTPTPPPLPTPSLSVSTTGYATWSYTLPQGAQFDYSRLRWKVNDPSEPLDRWFIGVYREFVPQNVNQYDFHQYLVPGTQYKAQFILTVQMNGSKIDLHSDILVFTMQEPTPTPTPTATFTPTPTPTPLPVPALSTSNTGYATWSYTLPEGAQFDYSWLRWKVYDPSEPLDRWFIGVYRESFPQNVKRYDFHQYLVPGAQYKAQFILTVQMNGSKIDLHSDILVFTVQKPTPTPTPTATPDPLVPVLEVSKSGYANWNYNLPQGANFSYSEVRWKVYDPTENINDWSGRSSTVFYSADASEYQIPNLTPGTRYKAKVFVGVQQNGSAVYLKSNVVVFP